MQKLFVLTLWPTSQASVYNVGHSILCFELAKVFQSKLQMTEKWQNVQFEKSMKYSLASRVDRGR